MNTYPKKFKPAEIEQKWLAHWKEHQTYTYHPDQFSETYTIDTPPPTVSGSLHIGHVFSYTQTDCLARYHRMLKKNIFYPMGWDDNGLPTERRVQNLYGITCDPHLPYIENWNPKKVKAGTTKKTPVSRNNFLEICSRQTSDDELIYEKLWTHLGLSVDWNLNYATIDPHCRKTSQLSFLDLGNKNFVYSKQAPTLWDTTFQTAVAQAEVEERTQNAFYHDIEFKVDSDTTFTISTTRPELLPACVAVVAHPDDERYQPFFGKFATTPLFEVKVPIMPAEHADPEKGTGILMVCTFGDSHDVEFWKQQNLPTRQIIGRDGRFIDLVFGQDEFSSENPSIANQFYNELKGLYAKQAQKKVVEFLRTTKALIGEPKPTEHPVRFYEKGELPLEFVTTRQWFVKILEHKEVFLEQGKKIKWHPEHMHKRYEQWVNGLNQDWCISRQRYFGVPFPVWYPLNDVGEPLYDLPIFAKKHQLPIDPQIHRPEEYSEEQRGKANGFVGDLDVMDTWATSSMTPQINSKWAEEDKSKHNTLFPASLRPQAHEIIRTWAFYTIVKSWMHDNQIPWTNIAISGLVVDPNRKKLSKSKDNSEITPEDLILNYSADAIRYWACRAKLGNDTLYDENTFKIGQKLATKLFNASKFVMIQLEDSDSKDMLNRLSLICTPLDLSWMEKMKDLVKTCTQSFEDYEASVALMKTEDLFWEFCDNYLELVKQRAYQQKNSPQGASALSTLEWSLFTFLRLFAPHIPYITEEIWSWRFAQHWGDSVHTSQWPLPNETTSIPQPEKDQLFEVASFVMGKIRNTKTMNQKSLNWPVCVLKLAGHEQNVLRFKLIQDDIVCGGRVIVDGISTSIDSSLNDPSCPFQTEVILSETNE